MGRATKAFLTLTLLGVLVVGLSFQAAGFKTEVLGVGLPIHQNMTRAALSFLKTSVLDDIVDEHPFVELFHPGRSFHFDDCAFQDTTQNINARYNRAVAGLNPAAPDLEDAPDAFGQLLHPAQDFYSHTNWVEHGRRGLIDTGFGLWTVLTPFSVAKGVVLVQGETIPAGFTATRTGKIVTVTTPGGASLPGLISGSFPPVDDCPDSVALSHGDLNKDGPARVGHGVALSLATAQTTHEWCRLVNLVKQNYGRQGVQFLFDNWVADEEGAIGVCPNADIVFLIDTTGSMFDDIQAVRAATTTIIDALDQSPVITRLALGTYKDFPVAPFGGPTDFPFRADLPFTLGENVKTAIGRLRASGGFNFPESVHFALMETISGSLGAWRKDADVKAIILMGDAPPHDPEPFTGFTRAQVLAAAFAADPIVIHTVPIGFSFLTLQAFTALAEGSGGGVFRALSAGGVPAAILSAIEEILSQPPNEPPFVECGLDVVGDADDDEAEFVLRVSAFDTEDGTLTPRVELFAVDSTGAEFSIALLNEGDRIELEVDEDEVEVEFEDDEDEEDDDDEDEDDEDDEDEPLLEAEASSFRLLCSATDSGGLTAQTEVIVDRELMEGIREAEAEDD